VKKQLIYAGMQSDSRGFSIWILSFSLLLLGAGLLMILRLRPGYIEYMTVKDLISRAAAEHDARTDIIPDLGTRPANLLTTHQINDTTIQDIRIYRERGVIVIDANYENRFSLVWILDGVMKFDDLIVETGPAGRT